MALPPRRRRTLLSHPAQVLVSLFAAAIAMSTSLLMLPVSAESGEATGLRTALFTATSAVCVTGLTVVDTASHWSTFGEVVILGSFQIGGFGIMTLASLLGLLMARRLGLRTRLLAQAETRSLGLGDVRRLLRTVAVTTVALELIGSVVLCLRLWLGYDESLGKAAYLGVFQSVSAFTNASFALWSDSLVRFVDDPLIYLPIAAGIIIGGIGFPVLYELSREFRSPGRWSLHTKITLSATALMLAGGTAALTAFEWTNPATFGPLGVAHKVLTGFFHASAARTAGFSTVDFSQMSETSWLVSDVLMFIGGGSASTAGGIKVTTFMLLFFVIVAEARGIDDTNAFGRRVPVPVIRQAISVALLGVAVVVTGTLAVLAVSGLDLDRVLLEVVSAFSTTGLSTGITADLPATAQYVLVAIMFIGRLGTSTVAYALAQRFGAKLYRLPEERPIVG